MKSYGQFCPVAKAAELFCERWTPLILRDLAAGSTRFSELQRGVPLMSPTLLAHRLKEFEAEGILDRKPQSSGKGYSYHLTEAGAEFIPVVEALGVWGQRWSRRELAENEVDLGLLVWAMERSVNPQAFEAKRTVIRVEFTDRTGGERLWWFINENGACELCLHDPGHEVDLFLACTLPDMIYIVRGDLPLARALDTERLEVIGSAHVRDRLADWFNLAPYTAIRSQRGDAVPV
ncbi:MAG: winged helix-turn-helix transcriptional regulator [Rhodomicrobiaceae bacterium]